MGSFVISCQLYDMLGESMIQLRINISVRNLTMLVCSF